MGSSCAVVQSDMSCPSPTVHPASRHGMPQKPSPQPWKQYEETWTIERFRSSSRSHLASAAQVLISIVKTRPHDMQPGTVAYLSHLALECMLKAMILYRSKCAGVRDLERKNKDVHDALFRGRHGHNIESLAAEINLPQIARIEGIPWKEDECWGGIVSEERPYSVRYHTGSVSERDATAEHERATELIGVLMSRMPSISLRSGKRVPGRKDHE